LSSREGSKLDLRKQLINDYTFKIKKKEVIIDEEEKV